MSTDNEYVHVKLWAYANEVVIEFDREVDRHAMSPTEALDFAAALILGAEHAIEKLEKAATERPSRDREGGH
jgi:hypothetical protein